MAATDHFGSQLGGNRAKANAALRGTQYKTMETMEEIIAEGGLHGQQPTVYEHLNRMSKRGYVITDDSSRPYRYALSESGTARRDG
jgi:hypothetical protein